MTKKEATIAEKEFILKKRIDPASKPTIFYI